MPVWQQRLHGPPSGQVTGLPARASLPHVVYSTTRREVTGHDVAALLAAAKPSHEHRLVRVQAEADSLLSAAEKHRQRQRQSLSALPLLPLRAWSYWPEGVPTMQISTKLSHCINKVRMLCSLTQRCLPVEMVRVLEGHVSNPPAQPIMPAPSHISDLVAHAERGHCCSICHSRRVRQLQPAAVQRRC